MSHYSVAVFVRDPADLDERMAPFYEGVEPDSPYAVFREDTEGGYTDPATGKKGWISNPNAKWDWYEVGGRWSGLLKLKEGRIGIYTHLSQQYADEQRRKGCCDVARIADCDFSPNEKAYNALCRKWEVTVEDAPLKPDEKADDFFLIYTKEYMLEYYGTKENYARSGSTLSTFAYLTEDGEWVEPGMMGWFGMDSSTRESRENHQLRFEEYLKKAEAEGLYMMIVDCHI